LTISGAVTIALSVFLAAVLFVLAVIPLLVGVLQARAGIAAMVRMHRGRFQNGAAAIGVVVGVLHLPESMFNPDGDEWRTLLGLALITANAAAAFVFIRQSPVEQTPDSN
jgi:hypothetical protein